MPPALFKGYAEKVQRQGFSLVELLVVLLLLGLLLALLPPRLAAPDRRAVDQAARGLSEQVVRARLEAIRNNVFAGIQFDPSGAGGYTVFLDSDTSFGLSPGDRVLQKVLFGQGDWARVRLKLGASFSAGEQTAPSAPVTLLFDPRGIPQDFPGLTVVLTNPQGTYTKRVEITPQGRAK
ncbi:MAG: prepilin [Thermoleophilia bacterium]